MEENLTFDREKLSKSIYIALKKRPIDTDTVEKFITKISRSLEELGQTKLHHQQSALWLWRVLKILILLPM